MKNFKRLFLLLLLVFFAKQVLFSDFEISKPENNTTAAVNK